MDSQFLVLEGPDGSGTTTHAALLNERLIAFGVEVALTCEPTDGPIGLFIRQALTENRIPPDALQLLFTADRAWHVQSMINPALEKGKTVISDRYWLSTYVYAQALGLDPLPFLEMNKTFVQPTKQIIFLPPFDVCLERLGQRESRDMLEEDSLQQRVYDGYKAYAKEYALPIVDSSSSIEEVSERVFQLSQ